MDAIQADHVDGGTHSYKVVFLGADQQLYDRMVTLIRENPDEYGWIIPVAGEFHFTAHCVDAVHRLYWNGLVGWVVKKLESEKIVKKNEDNITHYKQYDRFYQLLTVAILTVLSEVVPLDLLMQPELLLKQCRGNAGLWCMVRGWRGRRCRRSYRCVNFVPYQRHSGAFMLIHYLFYAGLPLLALRTAVRSNNHDAIDYMWLYMLPMFRAAGKTLYSKLCVHVIHTYYRLKPELRTIFNQHRTASLRGNNGRNVGWDFTLERMNLEVQIMLGNNISEERIPEVIRYVNFTRPISMPLSEMR